MHEGDTLSSTILVEEATPLAAGGGALRLRSTVVAHGDDSDREVLDWRFRVLMA